MFYRDLAAANFKRCVGEGCSEWVLPPRRKCNKCRKARTKQAEVLRASTRGKNKRGVCLHKAEKSRVKRPKRQNVARMNVEPTLRMTNWEEFK